MCSLLCRLCLSDSAELYNIWSVMYDGVQASSVIQEIFKIRVTQNDVTTLMCPTCKATLGDFYKFYNIVKTSQRKLLNKLIDIQKGITEIGSIDNKSILQSIVHHNTQPETSDNGPDYNDPLADGKNESDINTTDLLSSEFPVRKIVSEIGLPTDDKTKSIGINPQTDEIEVKLDPASTAVVQTIDVNNLPNKVVVQKVSKNFKIINNSNLKKVTRIILAKNIPANVLQQKDIVQKLVNNVLPKEKEPIIAVQDQSSNLQSPNSPTPDFNNDYDDDQESSEDEVLSKTKSRLIKTRADIKLEEPQKRKLVRNEARNSLNNKKTVKKGTRISAKNTTHTRPPYTKSKEQLEKLLKQIEEEKKTKEIQKLSKTEYEAGPEYDPGIEDNLELNDSDIELFNDENRKLTPTEIEQVYKNGKLVATGTDLEMLYRRIFGLQCEICDRKFKTLNALFTHYKEVHKGMGFVRCCKRKFFARYSVNRHLIKHIRPRSVECPICKKVISRKKSLGVHMQVHLPMDQRRYQCGQCKLGFTHMAQLNHHVARRHSDLTTADLYQCDICLKRFTTKPVHDYHRRSVHKEATDLCQECGKKFKTVASLNAHIKRLHTEGGDPRMKCPHCTSVCKKSNLKTHIKTVHENIKKPCPHCGEKVFPKSMRSHIKIKHDLGLLYPCVYCGKTFKCEKYLKFHVVQHTGVPNFICEYCPKTFASSGNYHTHRKRVHKRELEKIAQEKLLNTESLPVYNPEEEKRTNRSQIKCDPELLQSIRYKNPTIFTMEPQDMNSDLQVAQDIQEQEYSHDDINPF